ncbi:MAG: hypothetical protein KAS32_19750 [Candidatus Peribacteraceae bacterium]|nr:hypothetical protein [Candidatus Peribacteraceae bacterium]
MKSIQANRGDHKLYQPIADTANRNRERSGPSVKLYVHPSITTGPSSIAQGAELGNKLRKYIGDITIEEDERMATMLQIQFNDPDHVVSSSDLLRSGSVIDIQIGYNRNTVYYGRRVELVAAYPIFPQDGIPTFTVKGYDGRHHMTLGDYLPRKREEQKFSKYKDLGAVVPGGRKRRKGATSSPVSFKKKTDSQIIDEIASHYGYAIDIDPTITRRNRVKKKNISDWAFILRLAKLNNYTAWVDFDDVLNNWVVHFRKKMTKFVDGYILDYGTDDTGMLRSVALREELSKQVSDIEVVHFDKRLRKLSWQTLVDQKRFSVPDGPLKTGRMQNVDEVAFVDAYGASVKFRVGGRYIKTFNDKPFKDKKEAQRWAKHYIINQQEDFLLAEGQVIGIENLRPRQIHMLTGIGRYNGEYYFTQTRHKFPKDAPYVTDFIGYRLLPEEVFLDLRVKQFSSEFGGSTMLGK